MNRSFPFKQKFNSKGSGVNVFRFMDLDLISNETDSWCLRENAVDGMGFNVGVYKDKFFGFNSKCIYSLNDDFSISNIEYKSKMALLYLSSSEAILLLEMREKEIKALDKDFNIIGTAKASGFFVQDVIYFQAGFYEFKEKYFIKTNEAGSEIINYPSGLGFYSSSRFVSNKVFLELCSEDGYSTFEFVPENDSFLEVFSCDKKLSYVGVNKDRCIFLSGKGLYIKDPGKPVFCIEASGNELLEFDGNILVYSSGSNCIQLIDEKLDIFDVSVGNDFKIYEVFEFEGSFVLSLTRCSDQSLVSISPLYDFKFDSLESIKEVANVKFEDFCCSSYSKVSNKKSENEFDLLINIPYMNLFSVVNETLGVTLEMFQEYCVRSNLIDSVSEPKNFDCSNFSGVFLYDISDEYNDEQRSSIKKVIEILFRRYVFESECVSSYNDNLIKFDFAVN